MPDKRKRWVIYYDETMLKDMQLLREETAKKDAVPVEEISIRRVVSDVTREKAIEYKDKQNNRARITTIVDGQARHDERIAALEDAIRELTAEVKKLKGGDK